MTKHIEEIAPELLDADSAVERAAALIALALLENAKAIRYAAWTLGTADAATSMGALEVVSAAIKESGDAVAYAISNLEKFNGS